MQVLNKDNIVAVTGGMSNADIAEATGIVLEGAMGLLLACLVIQPALEEGELARIQGILLVGSLGMLGDVCFRVRQLIDSA